MFIEIYWTFLFEDNNHPFTAWFQFIRIELDEMMKNWE